MRSNPALQRLRRGETVLGMFAIDLYSTGLARTASSAGAEFVVFDQEHTGWGLVESAGSRLRHLSLLSF